MKTENHKEKDLCTASLFPLQGRRFCERGLDTVHRASFFTGMASVAVLGSMLVLSTPVFAMGGGGGGDSSSPAPKVAKVKEPVASPAPAASESKTRKPEKVSLAIDGPDEDKTPNKPDERTTDFPGNKVPGVVGAVVSFTASATRIEEGEIANLQVALNKPLSGALALSLRAGGTATEGSDYSLPAEVRIPQGATNADMLISVREDTLPELDETITITLGGNLPQGVSFGTQSHTIIIPANDQAAEIVVDTEKEETPEVATKPDDDTDDKTGTDPEDKTADKPEVPEVIDAIVGFATPASSVKEGDDARWTSLQVELSKPLPQTLTLEVVFRGRSAWEADIYSLSEMVTFSEGETTASISFIVRDDSVVEPDESFLVALRHKDRLLPDGVTFGTKGHVVTIIDNDIEDDANTEDKTSKKPDEETIKIPEPEVVEATVGFAEATTHAAGEGAGPQSLQVVLSNPLPKALTLSLSLSGSSTASAGDITFSPHATFPQGETVADVDFTVLEDVVPEQAETITLTLGGALPDGVTFATQSHTVTIPANDNVITFSEPSSASIAEEGGVATVTATVNQPMPVSVGAVAVTVTPGGSAVRDTDYRLSVSGGSLSGNTWTLPAQASNAELIVTAIGNSVDAEDKTLTLDFAAAGLLPDGWALGHTYASPITIVDDDVTEIVIDTEKEETPEVAIKPDDDADDKTGTDTEDKTPNKPDERTAEFPNNEVDAVVGFTTSATRVKEGHAVNLLVKTRGQISENLTLPLQLRFGGTATEGSDIELLKNEDFVLQKKEKTAFWFKKVTVYVRPDGEPEPDETVTITLEGSLPQGVSFDTQSHTITIPANDQATEIVEKPGEPLPEISVRPDEKGKISIINEDHVRRIRPERCGDNKNSMVLVENLGIVDHEIYLLCRGSFADISIKNTIQGIVHGKVYLHSDGRTSIENWGTVGRSISAFHYDGEISIVNHGTVNQDIEAKHYGDGRVSIVNHGTIGTRIEAHLRGNGRISIANHGTVDYIKVWREGSGGISIANHGTVNRHMRVRHRGDGEISVANRGIVNGGMSIRHYGDNGIIRFSGNVDGGSNRLEGKTVYVKDIVFNGGEYNELRIKGDYNASSDTQLSFYVDSNGWIGDRLRIDGDVSGQSRVSLVVDDVSFITESVNFPTLIVVEKNHDVEADNFVGEQVIGAFNYVLEHGNGYQHEWSFVNKGLSDTAKKVAEIPDDTKKDINTPPTTYPDKKKELGLWGGLDSSHTDIGLSFPAFVSNDDYHVGSQVQYYLKEDRSGIRALVETEYNFDIMNFRITPHARLTWTRVGFDDFVGPNRERISLVDGDTVDLGLGLSFDNEYQISNGLARIYGGANLLSPLDGETSVRISGFTIVNEQDDLSVDGKLGLSYEWGEGYAVHGEASAAHHDGVDEIRADLRASIDF